MRFHIRDNFCTAYKLNLHRLQQYLIDNGHFPADDPDKADVVIAGVCAAFEADEIRSDLLLQDLASHDRPFYVIGCLVTVRPDLMPAAAELFPAWEYRALARELAGSAASPWEETPLPSGFRSRSDYRVPDPSRHFVAVSLGCDFECSYCPHRLGAGPSDSRQLNQIVGQVRDLLTQGAKTIILTGVDTASYGRDSGSSFGELLSRILALPGNRARFHIAQFNPEGISTRTDSDKMAECCADPRVADLQLPIQTTSPRLLRMMNRHYDMPSVSRFVRRVRQANPGLFIRTDLMIGFPTETDDEFRSTIEFVAGYFDEAAVYAFEMKPGTPIASLEHARVSNEVIRARQEAAVAYLGQAGLLVHSGAQRPDTLRQSDAVKAAMRSSALR